MNISDSAYIRRFFSLYSQEEKDKVRGHAFFPTDYISALLPPDVLHVGVVRSPYAGATFKRIDFSETQKIPGVVRVISATDIPKNLPYGSRASAGPSGGQYILAAEKVRYSGEPVALLVAESVEALEQALPTIKIDWVEKPLPKSEVIETVEHRIGKSQGGSLEVLKTSFKFPSLQTRYLEAESGWLEVVKDRFVFHVGSLLSESQRSWVSQIIGVPVKAISAKESPLGGQFGGRQQRELIAFLALAGFLTKRAVCLYLNPQEQDVGSYGYSGELAVHYDKNSKQLKELSGKIVIDSGSYEGNAHQILKKTLEHAASIYRFDFIDLVGQIVLTPSFPRRSLKGEGLSAITWVTEQLVERIAKILDISPIEFRALNCGEQSERGKDVLKEAEKIEKPFRLLPIDRNRPVWDEKEILGRGMAFQVFQPTTQKEFDHSEISIELQQAGSFLIRTSNLTLDLHVKSALCEVAAVVLHTHPKAFTVEGNMRLEFEKPARRETYPEFYYLAQATWNAAYELKEKLLSAGKKVLNSDQVVLKDGAVVEVGSNRKKGYRELAFTVSTHDMRSSYILKDIERPHGCSGGAIARVAFHPLTGEIRVESVKVVLDAGPVLYEKGLEIEVDSAVSWAMAVLFSTETTREQPIPTPMDGPEEVTLVTLDYKVKDYADQSPEIFGARGVTDILKSVVLASLINAIQDAKGVSLEEIPMSAEFMYPKRKHQTVHTLPFKR